MLNRPSVLPLVEAFRDKKTPLALLSKHPAERRWIAQRLLNIPARQCFDSQASDLPALFENPSFFSTGEWIVIDNAERLDKALVKPHAPILFLGEKIPLTTVYTLDLTHEKPWDRKSRLMAHFVDAAKKEGVHLYPDAATSLFDRVGGDPWLFEQELAKLITYVGTRCEITHADIAAIACHATAPSLYKTAEALLFGLGTPADTIDEADTFFPFLAYLRSLAKIGIELAEGRKPTTSLFPKTLEAYTTQAKKRGTPFFISVLHTLFHTELTAKTTTIPIKHLYLKLAYDIATLSQPPR